MPSRASKKKKSRPDDEGIGSALRAVEATIGETLAAPKTERELRSQAARLLSQLGASKGGKARAAVLSKKRRTQIAKHAAKTRWGKP
jgi:hypothetical protein